MKVTRSEDLDCELSLLGQAADGEVNDDESLDARDHQPLPRRVMQKMLSTSSLVHILIAASYLIVIAVLMRSLSPVIHERGDWYCGYQNATATNYEAPKVLIIGQLQQRGRWNMSQDRSILRPVP